MTYRSIPFEHTIGPTPLVRPATRQQPKLAEHAPATSVMVDFAVTPALTIAPERGVDAALEQMRIGGVRSLLVMVEDHVVGLITADDIQGEKPVQFVQSTDCVHPRCHHDDVEVGDVMTAVGTLPMLRTGALEGATIGDLMETFRKTGRTHLLCTDECSDGTLQVRGLISRAHIERQLNFPPDRLALEQVEREMAGFFLSRRLPI